MNHKNTILAWKKQNLTQFQFTVRVKVKTCCLTTPFVFRGQRGNAVGFKLSSLTRIADTKSSCNKNMTLLHYIADTCQHKFRDCLLLEADMPHVRDAAKVKWVHMMTNYSVLPHFWRLFSFCFSMKELEKDMAILRNGMKEVGRELEFFRTQPPTNGDR